MKIGLTGGIASGKNFISSIFERYGYYAIDLDKISREVMVKGTDCYNEVVSTFGRDILKADDEIDRKKLANIIFNDSSKKSALEKITHYAIFEAEDKIISKIKSKDDKAIILTHAALIIESKNFHRYDYIILIHTDEETQVKRVMNRDNIDEATAKLIISNQMPYSEKVKFADFIIDNNNCDNTHTENEVKRIVKLISEIRYGVKHINP